MWNVGINLYLILEVDYIFNGHKTRIIQYLEKHLKFLTVLFFKFHLIKLYNHPQQSFNQLVNHSENFTNWDVKTMRRILMFFPIFFIFTPNKAHIVPRGWYWRHQRLCGRARFSGAREPYRIYQFAVNNTLVAELHNTIVFVH